MKISKIITFFLFSLFSLHANSLEQDVFFLSPQEQKLIEFYQTDASLEEDEKQEATRPLLYLDLSGQAQSGNYSYDAFIHYPQDRHHISGIGASKESIEIENGAAWKIHSGFKRTVEEWELNQDIFIYPNTNWSWYTDYAYKLHNADTGTYVYANLDLGPYLDHEKTYTIAKINRVRGLLQFENGEKWVIYHKDLPLFQEWSRSHTVMIGTNKQWWHAPNYILINCKLSGIPSSKSKCIRAMPL